MTESQGHLPKVTPGRCSEQPSQEEPGSLGAGAPTGLVLVRGQPGTRGSWVWVLCFLGYIRLLHSVLFSQGDCGFPTPALGIWAEMASSSITLSLNGNCFY